MNTRHDALLGLMRERNITQKSLADAIDMSERTLNAKLQGKADFKTREIALICVTCGITQNEIAHYFFDIETALN